MDAFSKVIPKKIKLSDYTIERTLGTGSFGRVKLAKNKTNGKYVAIKILKKAEIIKLKQVDHIHVLRFLWYKIEEEANLLIKY